MGDLRILYGEYHTAQSRRSRCTILCESCMIQYPFRLRSPISLLLVPGLAELEPHPMEQLFSHTVFTDHPADCRIRSSSSSLSHTFQSSSTSPSNCASGSATANFVSYATYCYIRLPLALNRVWRFNLKLYQEHKQQQCRFRTQQLQHAGSFLNPLAVVITRAGILGSTPLVGPGSIAAQPWLSISAC